LIWKGGVSLFFDIDRLFEQLQNLLQSLLNEITRFIEQNFDFVGRIIQAFNNFLAWLEGLVTF